MTRRELLSGMAAGTLLTLGVPGLARLAAAVTALPEGFPGTQTLVYDIVRDKAVVGHHRVAFVQNGDEITVTTDVDISVSVLFITVYTLDHHGVETWKDGVMTSFKSQTNDNGEKRFVEIVPESGDWRVVRESDLDIRPGDALIGSLWHPDTVNSTMLLDPIKGKLRKVRVTERGVETITVPLGTVQARHISIAGDVEQEVWYGPDGHIWQVDFPVKAGGRLTLKRRQ